MEMKLNQTFSTLPKNWWDHPHTQPSLLLLQLLSAAIDSCFLSKTTYTWSHIISCSFTPEAKRHGWGELNELTPPIPSEHIARGQGISFTNDYSSIPAFTRRGTICSSFSCCCFSRTEGSIYSVHSQLHNCI